MATTSNRVAYESSAQITCSNASLASGSARESATVSNTASLDLDFLIQLTFTIASGSPSTAGPAVNVYANGNLDNNASGWPVISLSSGAPYTTGGGDSSVGALGSPPNLRLIGSFGLQTTTSSAERTFRTQPFSVAAAFGGEVPEMFSIVVENSTGIAFSSSTTTSANYLERVGIYTTNS